MSLLPSQLMILAHDFKNAIKFGSGLSHRRLRLPNVLPASLPQVKGPIPSGEDDLSFIGASEPPNSESTILC